MMPSPLTPPPTQFSKSSNKATNGQPQSSSSGNFQPARAPPPKPAPAKNAAPTKPEANGRGPREKKGSAMSEAQIMEKLRSVVSRGDPTTMYQKIKKIGQG
jgi:serine/threonine-protein kinase CLA4